MLPPGDKASVSVIIPCYNYGHFLQQCVNSVLAQKNVQVEIIIVDDKSTDDSAQVAEQLAIQDRRITLILHPKNAGHVVTFNTGLAAATGEFIVRLDADDLLTPGSLERAVALFRHFPTVGLVYGHPRHFTTPEPPVANETVRGWSVWSGVDWVTERCRAGVNVITTPEAVVRSDVFRSVGGLDTRLKFAQDMEMWLRTATCSDVGRVDGPDQAFHRDHAASMSATSGSGRLLDLKERLNVFDILFSGLGSQLPNAVELHNEARRALASEALVSAYAAYDRGRAPSADINEFIQFAIESLAEAHTLPQWRALRRRQFVGPHLAPYVPPFTASVLWRRYNAWKSYRKWERTGLW